MNRRGFIKSLFAAAAATLVPATVWKMIGTFGGEKKIRLFIDGTEEYLPFDGNDLVSGNGDFVIDFWFRRTPLGPGRLPDPVAGYLDELRVRTLGYDPDHIRIPFEIARDLKDGRWHHIAITRQRDNVA